MTIRMAPLLAAMALAFTPPPAFAQDAGYDPGSPPPLPELGDTSWDGEWDEYLLAAPSAAPSASEEHRAAPIERPRVILGYSSSERDAWLAECHERAQGRRDACEDFLARYEQAVHGPSPSPTSAPGRAGCGDHAAPVTWIRVPVARPARSR